MSTEDNKKTPTPKAASDVPSAMSTFTAAGSQHLEFGDAPRAQAVIALTTPPHTEQDIDDLTRAINDQSKRLNWKNYHAFINKVMCSGTNNPPSPGDDPVTGQAVDLEDLTEFTTLPFPNVERYRLLKAATEAFLIVNSTVPPTVFGKHLETLEDGSTKVLPYLAIIRRKFPELTIKLDRGADERCYGLLQRKIGYPLMLELIWSYWHEEAMLVQSLGAVSMRFQNRRVAGGRDPLAAVEIDPLRPLSNLLWGYIQDEQHRLTVARRAYEYLHHYGITIRGKAVPKLDYAESRSKFLEAFHTLLNITAKFYKQLDDMTVRADGFPVLNALREVHLLLSQGAHNQYGDLPWTARMEMLMEQWILARPEFREFLPRRAMVAYPEEWMDSVDSMRRLQGWGTTPVLHYNNLAVFGEQILLSIRWGNWTAQIDPAAGANWARLNRARIQTYIHDYRAVTGVDLSADRIVADKVDTQMPSVHLVKRLAAEQQAMRS